MNFNLFNLQNAFMKDAYKISSYFLFVCLFFFKKEKISNDKYIYL